MFGFFLSGIGITAALCVSTYIYLQRRVLLDRLCLDEAKGYLLIVNVLVAFVVSAVWFYVGQVLGYDKSEATSTLLALSILLDVTVALGCLIFGLQRMREPERY